LLAGWATVAWAGVMSNTEETAAPDPEGTESAEMSSLETPDNENPDDDKLKDGVPTADWLPESSPPTTSGPVP
jgi:hypothetical protein